MRQVEKERGAARRRRIAGVSATVFLLGIVSLANDFASEMIYPLLPVFLTAAGASVRFIGLIEGVAETTASLTKLFAGWIADRLGRKRTLTAAGYVLSNTVRPLIGAAGAGWHVLLLRFADRLGKGVRSAPRDAIIADSTPPAERGRAFGFNRAMDHGGAMLGSAAAFLLLAYGGASLRTVFFLSAIPGAVASACIVIGAGLARDPGPAPASPPSLSLAGLDRRFRAFLAILALFALGNSSDAFLLLRASRLGVPVSTLPLLWIVFHAVKSFTAAPAGVLSDRLGRTRMIAAGWAVYAAVYLGFASAAAAWHVWALFVAYGLFYGLTECVERAFITDLVPAAQRGTAFGLYHFTVGIAALPASVLTGLLWESFGPGVALGTGAVLAACAAALILFLRPARQS